MKNDGWLESLTQWLEWMKWWFKDWIGITNIITRFPDIIPELTGMPGRAEIILVIIEMIEK